MVRPTSLCMAMAIAAAFLVASVSAQSDGSCDSSIISMAPCLDYILGNTSTPTVACCSSVQKVLDSQPVCLCLVLGGAAAQFGVSVNRTVALELPGKCNMVTPPVSECNSVVGPNGAPGPSAGGGRGGGTPGKGTSERVSITVVFCLVFLASYALSTITSI